MTTLQDTFIKKIFSQIQAALWDTFIKKNFSQLLKKKTFFFTEKINFNEKEIKKVTFTKTKKAFQIDDIDVNKMLV